MFETKVVEKIKHTFYAQYLFAKIVPFIIRKIIVEPVRPQMTIYAAHASCMLGTEGYKYAFTVVILTAFPLQQ